MGPCVPAGGGELVALDPFWGHRDGDAAFALDLQPGQPGHHIPLHLHQHLAGLALVHRADRFAQSGADPYCGGHRPELRAVAVRAANGGAGAGAGADSAVGSRICGL
ncbi:MAG: hypothetical protein RL710_413, partial [Pseudomonadota bacterium]